MTLHAAEDRNDMAWWDGCITKEIAPPVMEGGVWSNLVFLFWTRCLTKRVTCVSPSNDMVVEGCVSIKEACGILVYTGSICVIKGVSLA